MTRTNYIMSLKDIHCDIQSFHYFTFYADDVAAGLSTEQEAYASGLEYADDIVWGMKYESLLIDLIDCGAVDYEDLFWTVVNIYPSAYTDKVRNFAEYCRIFTESPLQSN